MYSTAAKGVNQSVVQRSKKIHSIFAEPEVLFLKVLCSLLALGIVFVIYLCIVPSPQQGRMYPKVKILKNLPFPRESQYYITHEVSPDIKAQMRNGQPWGNTAVIKKKKGGNK